jgi:hypothetical protein
MTKITEIEYLDMPSGSFTHKELRYLGRRKAEPSKVAWFALLVVAATFLALLYVDKFYLTEDFLTRHAEAAETVCDDACICRSLERYDTKGMDQEIADYCVKHAGV